MKYLFLVIPLSFGSAAQAGEPETAVCGEGYEVGAPILYSLQRGEITAVVEKGFSLRMEEGWFKGEILSPVKCAELARTTGCDDKFCVGDQVLMSDRLPSGWVEIPAQIIGIQSVGRYAIEYKSENGKSYRHLNVTDVRKP